MKKSSMSRTGKTFIPAGAKLYALGDRTPSGKQALYPVTFRKAIECKFGVHPSTHETVFSYHDLVYFNPHFKPERYPHLFEIIEGNPEVQN